MTIQLSSLLSSSGALLQKASSASPALEISLLTLASRIAFGFMPNIFLKGATCCIHSYLTERLTSNRCKWAGTISLADGLQQFKHLIHAPQLPSLASLRRYGTVPVAMALSFLGGFHVITAITITHIAAALFLEKQPTSEPPTR